VKHVAKARENPEHSFDSGHSRDSRGNKKAPGFAPPAAVSKTPAPTAREIKKFEKNRKNHHRSLHQSKSSCSSDASDEPVDFRQKSFLNSSYPMSGEHEIFKGGPMNTLHTTQDNEDSS